ncbi:MULTISPECIES: hypothetical protein [unclassified Streptomyces]|uniref:hypothetical protein n=1 Tax=unclassified Streptomyces TaxID=2593676 RepID=UPI0038662E04
MVRSDPLIRSLDPIPCPPYPVLNEDYAIRIARDWNVKHDGAGFVTRFDVDTEFLSHYPVQQAGGRTILELWVPAEELDEFNAHIRKSFGPATEGRPPHTPLTRLDPWETDPCRDARSRRSARTTGSADRRRPCATR